MRTRNKAVIGLLSATGLLFSSGVAAHDSPNDGHIPSDVNYGFELVGRDTLAGISEFGNYTDVWSHNGFAYIGTFQEPCSDAGVFIVDVDAAIAQFQNGGNVSGATVADIKSAPNTRINDVKVHTVGDKDVLITTQEPCGMQIPAAPQSGGNPPGQVGQGGISLYDVTDPSKPKALKKNFLEFEGVHNTFPWTDGDNSYLIGTADTFDFFDTFFVDITKPQSPKLLTITGALDWIPQGLNLDQLETGSSAGIFNHDVWVEEIGGVQTAVVSYWDLGFVTLDVDDPANPVFLNDSTYVNPDPITGEPYEGNAHAAVFGGEGDYIFGGDEDFSPSSFAISYDGVDYPAGVALFGDDPATLAGNVEYVGGDGCGPLDAPGVADPAIALIDRGACFFSQKGFNAQTAGYAGYIIANNAGDGLLNMSAGDPPLPTIPGVFIGQSDGTAIKGNQGKAVSTSSIFDGWGYLHIINNTAAPIDSPVGPGSGGVTQPVAPGHELGYYAPYQTVEEFDDMGDPFGTDFGDLTMHNIEVDPTNQDETPTFFAGPRMFISWYSLGMRAVEYRPGHYHTNANDEGSWSQNVHEVGRWIDDDGSNFWGVHVDNAELNGDDTQVILASDRNLGLYIFTWECVDPDGAGPLYCETTP